MIVTTVRREVVDLALEFRIDIPTDWVELEVPGPLFAVAGALEAKVETLRPSVQLDIEPAEGAEAAFDALREGARALPECEVVVDATGSRGGKPALQLGWYFRNPDTGGMQVEMVLAVYLPAQNVLVRVTGTCGGAASEVALQNLIEIVNSTTVSGSPDAGLRPPS
jgi:hypothetical protein